MYEYDNGCPLFRYFSYMGNQNQFSLFFLEIGITCLLRKEFIITYYYFIIVITFCLLKITKKIRSDSKIYTVCVCSFVNKNMLKKDHSGGNKLKSK